MSATRTRVDTSGARPKRSLRTSGTLRRRDRLTAMEGARIRVVVASDAMSATLRVTQGPSAGAPELDLALALARVLVGIDEELRGQVADRLVDEQFTLDETVIARGQPPQPAEDGYFVPAFHVGIEPGHVRPDGTMDFLDRELLKPVQAG